MHSRYPTYLPLDTFQVHMAPHRSRSDCSGRCDRCGQAARQAHERTARALRGTTSLLRVRCLVCVVQSEAPTQEDTDKIETWVAANPPQSDAISNGLAPRARSPGRLGRGHRVGCSPPFPRWSRSLSHPPLSVRHLRSTGVLCPPPLSPPPPGPCPPPPSHAAVP